jgi:hypothetical protein
VISAQVLIGAVVGQQVPGDHQDAVPDGEYRSGLALLAEGAQQVAVLGRQIAEMGPRRTRGRRVRVRATSANRSGSMVSQGMRDSFWLWGMQFGLKGPTTASKPSRRST